MASEDGGLPDLLREADELCANATGGPWIYDTYSGVFGDSDHSDALARVPVVAGDTATAQGAHDADFIARSRTLIPELVEACKLMQAQKDNLHLRLELLADELAAEKARNDTLRSVNAVALDRLDTADAVCKFAERMEWEFCRNYREDIVREFVSALDAWRKSRAGVST